MKKKLEKYRGEVSESLLKQLRVLGYTENDLLEDEDGRVYIMYEEDEGSRHPDDPSRPGTYPMLIEDL